MKNKLQELLNAKSNTRFATEAGTTMHKKLEKVFFLPSGPVGDTQLCAQISKDPELVELMGPLSKTEVPVAGFVNNKFISRRIDRLYVSDTDKKVVVLDYKTDTNKKQFYEKYAAQLREYHDLLTQIFPEHSVSCKILWLCDFSVENVI